MQENNEIRRSQQTKLSDAEAIEAQVVENLQREDIHPLEEALGFRSLLELKDGTYTVTSIAGILLAAEDVIGMNGDGDD